MPLIPVNEVIPMAENLIQLIPPYAVFKITAVTLNLEYGVGFNLTYGEAVAASTYLVNEGFAIHDGI